MSNDPSPTYSDYLHADDVLAFMVRNLIERFQIDGLQMDPKEAKKHFENRAALCAVRILLLDEAERVGLPTRLPD